MTATNLVLAFDGGWGHAHGPFDLKVPATLSDLTSVIDRQSIADAIGCYSWSIDEQQWEVMAEIYTEDMTFSGCVAGVTNLETVTGSADFIEWLKGFLRARNDQLRHSLVNIVVTEQGLDSATALGYCVLASTTPAGANVQATGIYRFSLVKQGDRWRISAIYGGFDNAPF